MLLCHYESLACFFTVQFNFNVRRKFVIVFRYRKFLYVSMVVCFAVFVVWPFVAGGRSSMIQTGFEPVNAQIEALIVEGEETALATSSASASPATHSSPVTSESPTTSTPGESPAASITNITEPPPSKLKESPNPDASRSPDPNPNPNAIAIASPSPSPSHGLLDLNTATLKQLNDLPGIGESKARAILDYRKDKGRISKVEELTEVKGIGDKMLEKLKPFVYVTST
jgi:competence ComEA-like helix-hairpin-helix protein